MKSINLSHVFLFFLTLIFNISATAQVDSTFIFPYQQQHVHGPTVVELPNGNLLAAWFQGSGERWADDVAIMGARLKKGEKEWSAPFIMADVPGFPDINPMLFIDTRGKLWLMWYTVLANQWESSLPKYRISSDFEGDGSPVWKWQDVIHVKFDGTERGIQADDKFVAGINKQFDEYENYLKQDIFPANPGLKEKYAQKWPAFRNMVDSLAKGKNQVRKGRINENGQIKNRQLGYPGYRRIGWQTKNKPFITTENRLIVPLYSDGLECSIFAITDDWGANWQFSNPVVGGIGIQATIASKKDGTLVAYLRDNGPPPQRIQYTESHDNGLTWSIAKDTDLPNSGAGFDMLTLKNGNWVLVYNHSEKNRNNLAVALSTDEGKTWKKRFMEFDERDEAATRFHYPAVICANDGRLHTVYSYHRNDTNNGKTIKWVSFSEKWILE